MQQGFGVGLGVRRGVTADNDMGAFRQPQRGNNRVGKAFGFIGDDTPGQITRFETT